MRADAEGPLPPASPAPGRDGDWRGEGQAERDGGGAGEAALLVAVQAGGDDGGGREGGEALSPALGQAGEAEAGECVGAPPAAVVEGWAAARAAADAAVSQAMDARMQELARRHDEAAREQQRLVKLAQELQRRERAVAAREERAHHAPLNAHHNAAAARQRRVHSIFAPGADSEAEIFGGSSSRSGHACSAPGPLTIHVSSPSHTAAGLGGGSMLNHTPVHSLAADNMHQSVKNLLSLMDGAEEAAEDSNLGSSERKPGAVLHVQTEFLKLKIKELEASWEESVRAAVEEERHKWLAEARHASSQVSLQERQRRVQLLMNKVGCMRFFCVCLSCYPMCECMFVCMCVCMHACTYACMYA